MEKAVPRINAVGIAIVVAATIGACRGPAPADLLGSSPATEDDWYCSAGADGRWNCAQDPVPAAPPVAKRETAPAPAPAPANGRGQSVLDWPPEHFAVQLVALESAQAASAFAAEAGVPRLRQERIESGGRFFHVFVVGPFARRREAQATAARLAQRLPPPEPWVRPVGTLQAAIRRAP